MNTERYIIDNHGDIVIFSGTFSNPCQQDGLSNTTISDYNDT